MTCRVCGAAITPDVSVLAGRPGRLSASSRADCVYRCSCGAAYSNASREGARVLITARPELNVPADVREGLSGVLAASVNLVNRTNKREKFCFETSEDAVTWTVFRFLQKSDRLDAVVAPAQPRGLPALLFWGSAANGSDADRVAAVLWQASRGLGESPDRRTEPDVVIAWRDLLVFVEAKYRSGNNRKAEYAHFTRYLDRPQLFTMLSDEVQRAGYYELVRNWRVGIEVAERLRTDRFVLVNLGPPRLDSSAHAFSRSLAETPNRRFMHLTWSSLLANAGDLQESFAEYAVEKGLLTR